MYLKEKTIFHLRPSFVAMETFFSAELTFKLFYLFLLSKICRMFYFILLFPIIFLYFYCILSFCISFWRFYFSFGRKQFYIPVDFRCFVKLKSNSNIFKSTKSRISTRCSLNAEKSTTVSIESLPPIRI